MQKRELGTSHDFLVDTQSVRKFNPANCLHLLQIYDGYYKKSRQIHYKKVAKDVIQEIKIPCNVSDLVSKDVSHIKN